MCSIITCLAFIGRLWYSEENILNKYTHHKWTWNAPQNNDINFNWKKNRQILYNIFSGGEKSGGAQLYCYLAALHLCAHTNTDTHTKTHMHKLVNYLKNRQQLSCRKLKITNVNKSYRWATGKIAAAPKP